METQEPLAELKLRIIVTFAGHALSKWSRLMSRALGVIVREVSQCTYTLCMPTMRGTRDMMSTLVTLRPQWEHSSHAEIDMNDQYWAISRSDVKAAFEWGLSRLRNKRHGHGIFEFSLSKMRFAISKPKFGVCRIECIFVCTDCPLSCLLYFVCRWGMLSDCPVGWCLDGASPVERVLGGNWPAGRKPGN